MLTDPCADPGIFARVVQARLSQKTALITFFVFFVLNFYSFTVAYQWIISKKTIILQGFFFWGGGGRVQPIPGGGRGLGVQMLILETHSFPGGGPEPLSPLWIRTCDHLTTRTLIEETLPIVTLLL